jgi:hypothetical protein
MSVMAIFHQLRPVPSSLAARTTSGLPTKRELSPTSTDERSDRNYSGFDAISVRAVMG